MQTTKYLAIALLVSLIGALAPNEVLSMRDYMGIDIPPIRCRRQLNWFISITIVFYRESCQNCCTRKDRQMYVGDEDREMYVEEDKDRKPKECYCEANIHDAKKYVEDLELKGGDKVKR
jgi:hypothetical protein